jgi:hypothetical protein
MSGFLEELFLEGRNIVQGGLGVLFAGDRQVILLLTFYEQFEELRDMPSVLLPFEPRCGSRDDSLYISDRCTRT